MATCEPRINGAHTLPFQFVYAVDIYREEWQSVHQYQKGWWISDVKTESTMSSRWTGDDGRRVLGDGGRKWLPHKGEGSSAAWISRRRYVAESHANTTGVDLQGWWRNHTRGNWWYYRPCSADIRSNGEDEMRAQTRSSPRKDGMKGSHISAPCQGVRVAFQSCQHQEAEF